ncbi:MULTISPECIES: alcohol dehydrogenase catalytic domain-containing protein [Lactiplantibacillus]|uniref:alcohol dehydrogenase catalytic domain-containing protein n=1 Tax=Lactiplantibacillus TaxID=2767842 RepID=UPI0002BD2C70|nr:zinc-binding dehydrogenase [Lactiplantibacillus plantarum]AGO07961.1 alcohol dehydrogenase [Lactiplantibacillus plantarum 16]AMO29539.1 alcohol dehydrogenase [Lactiplantibacillus plantarum]APB85240.1 alcohol dehydrogenase [Lactiplantibacillus plantarum]AVV98938.1 alcohol dehydrogenase [Lactiplantibacillus plantarum]AVW07521.1 alcohol dehydrogenase [Lactiplantibacillus plantarum]
MKALFFNDFGDASVLQYGEVADPIVTANTVLVKTTYIGLNFADIYRRRGTYHLEKHQPYIDGYEGVGTVVAVGKQVANFKRGDRVLFVDVPFANASLVAVPADQAIKVPRAINDQQVASIGLQGMTAEFLVHDLAQSQPHDRVLIHGISGGVGQLLTQLLVANEVAVYGVASTPAKAELAYQAGATTVFMRHDPWDTTHHNFFDTVFDGVGKTLPVSLATTKHRGRVIFYGMAAGNPPVIDPVKLMSESKSLMTGDLWDYLDSAAARQCRANQLFDDVLTHRVTIRPATVYSLAEGAAAHRALETGQVAGKILLRP